MTPLFRILSFRHSLIQIQRRQLSSAHNMTSKMRQRSVVSSFICTSPHSPQGLTFALFKRSKDVGTYQGKWAVCSGSIDPTDASPEAAAKREIQEETTLSDSDITLLRSGKPFNLTDEELKTEWTVYPFAWQLKEGAKPIKFDWEHTEYHFIKPEELDKYDHVPQLEVGMRRVMVSPELEKGLAILRDDHESGAQALALKALQILKDVISGDELSLLSSSEQFWHQLRWVAWHLSKNGRPSMAAAIEAGMLKALNNVKDVAYMNVASIPLQKLERYCQEAIENTISARQHSLENLAGQFVGYIESHSQSQSTLNIVTLSASGTITKSLVAFLAKHADRKVKLSVLESRPIFEGVAFVNGLLALLPDLTKTLSVEIVSDASVSTVVGDADYVILGGDRVNAKGDVSNKIGSYPLCLVAKTLNPKCKIIALFTTDKITSGDSEHVEYNAEAELTGSWPEKVVEGLTESRKRGYQVDVKNSYFEWVPAKYIDQYISEDGCLGKEGIEKVANESEELEKRIFKDL